MIKAVALLTAACGSPLDLRGELAPMAEQAEQLAADMLPDLDGWRIVVASQPTLIECAGSNTALGCTSHSVSNQSAYVRLAMAPGWSLERTAFVHELTHIWLLETTGNGDASHNSAVWRR